MYSSNQIKILIIVNWYPPDKEVAARRWGNIVFELQNSGFKCTIVIVGPDEMKSFQGNSGEKILNFTIEKKSVLKGNQEKKVKRTFCFLIKLKRQIVNFIPEYILSRYLRNVRINKKIINYLNDAAIESDFVISSFGEWNAFIIGYKLALKYNKPWIADIRDWFEHKTNYNKHWPIQYIDRLLTMKMLQKAYLRLTVGTFLSKFLSDYYKCTFHAIYNGWTDNDVLSIGKELFSNNKYLFYAGTIYNHQLSGLKVLIEALKSFPEICLKLRLLKDSTKVGMKKWIEQNNYSDRVMLLPPANIEVIEYELALSHGVIVIEDIDRLNEAKLGTVTGKLLKLLVSGKPGLAIAAKQSEINYLTSKANGWYCVDNIDDCKNAIKIITIHETVVDNTAVLKEYNMRVQAGKLLQMIKSIHSQNNNI